MFDFVFVITGFAELKDDDEDSVESEENDGDEDSVEYDKNDGGEDSAKEEDEDDVLSDIIRSCDAI